MNKRTKIFPYVIILIYLCFNVFFVFSQESYNNCNQAIDLCPNQILSANNINANKTLCTDCEDDFSSKIRDSAPRGDVPGSVVECGLN